MNKELAQIHGTEVQEKLERIPMPESHIGGIQSQLEQTVFGQDEALGVISQRLGIIESGLSQRDKPLGAIFMLGATGVGKTETAHAIAKRWFGNPNSERLKILNCAEFTQSHSITRIVGSPPSFVGWQEQSALPHSLINETDNNGDQKRTIILLDEFEKAHPDVHQLFLGALDKGKLDARKGSEGAQPLDFTNTLFLFTSNISADKIQEINDQRHIGFSSEVNESEKSKQINSSVKQEMNRAFSPEFRNRLTDTVVYKTLERDSGVYEQVFWKFMEQQNNDLSFRLKGKAPYLMATRELIESVVDSIDTTYGARDLKRAIERQILGEFTNLLMGTDLSGKIIVAHKEDNGEVGFYTNKQTYELVKEEETIFEPEVKPKKKLSPKKIIENPIDDPNDGTRYIPRDPSDEDDTERKKLDEESKR